MDFHAFKRSKAVQSPVCLVGWNSRGTSVPVARGTQSSMAVTELTELCRSIDYRRVWTPSCPQLKPWPRQSRAKPHLLCSKGTTAFPAAQAARGASAHPVGQEGEAPPAHAAAAVPACLQGRETAPLLYFCVSTTGCFWTTRQWQGKEPALTNTQPLSESCGVTCYEHHPQTSITPQPKLSGGAQLR